MATRAMRRLRSRMRATASVFDCSSASLMLSLPRDAREPALEALGLRVIVHHIAVERAVAPAIVDVVLPTPRCHALLREEIVYPVEHLGRLLSLVLRFKAHGVLYHPVLFLAVTEERRIQSHARERVEERELIPLAVAGGVVVAAGVDAVGEVELFSVLPTTLPHFQSVDDAAGRRVHQRHERR